MRKTDYYFKSELNNLTVIKYVLKAGGKLTTNPKDLQELTEFITTAKGFLFHPTDNKIVETMRELVVINKNPYKSNPLSIKDRLYDRKRSYVMNRIIRTFVSSSFLTGEVRKIYIEKFYGSIKLSGNPGLKECKLIYELTEASGLIVLRAEKTDQKDLYKVVIVPKNAFGRYEVREDSITKAINNPGFIYKDAYGATEKKAIAAHKRKQARLVSKELNYDNIRRP